MARPSPVTGQDMAEREFLGVEVDVCPATGGIWLDPGELGRLIRAAPGELKAVDDAVKPEGQPPQPHTSRRCPVCRIPLYRYRYLQTSEIVLDGCEECGGVFVEDGELGAIAGLLQVREEQAEKEQEKVASQIAHALQAEEGTNLNFVDSLIRTLRWRRHGW